MKLVAKLNTIKGHDEKITYSCASSFDHENQGH